MSNGNGSGLTTAVNSDPDLQDILAKLGPDQRAYVVTRIAGAVKKHAKRSASQVIPDVGSGPTGQRFRLWNMYYSVVRFQAAVSVVSTTTTLTFVVGDLRPFAYAINDPLTQAGFDSSFGAATIADTNLVTKSQTIAGEQVQVGGLSLMPSSVTDIGLWKQLVANIGVQISMDGAAHTYRLGRPDMIPASGGTTGTGYTPTLTPALASSQAFDSGFSNGWPVIDNYLPFPEPLIWTSAGQTDSNFNVVLSLVRQVVVVETARAAASGVAAFSPPTAAGQFGTFVDFMVRLHCNQSGARSVNQ